MHNIIITSNYRRFSGTERVGAPLISTPTAVQSAFHSAKCFSQCIVHISQCTVLFRMKCAQCLSQCTIHSTFCSAQCFFTVHSAHFIVQSAQCTMHFAFNSIQCISQCFWLCRVQCQCSAVWVEIKGKSLNSDWNVSRSPPMHIDFIKAILSSSSPLS